MLVRLFLIPGLFVLLLCGGISAAYGQFTPQDFSVRSMGADVLVEWEVLDETGITEFRLFRQIDSQGAFEFLNTIYANGGYRYQYLDDNIYKDGPRVLTYKLQVVRDGKTHDFFSTLSHNPTSIQRTWGSIKSMFR
jgi:hypothetical protein